MKRSRLPFIVTILVIVFMYLPIIVLVVNSFNESRFGGTWEGFSLKWYERLFHDRGIWHAIRNTFIVGISATLISTILGTMSAFALYRYKNSLQKVHYGLVYTPLVIPDILMGMSLLLLFISLKFPLGLFSIFIAHTTFCMSYVAMVVLARLDTFDYNVVEAAQDLGANPWTIVWRVVVPLLAPGILSGALLAFTMSIDDYIITSFVSGPGATTLPLKVYGMIKFGVTPVINALSTILLTVTFVLVWMTERLTKESVV